MSSAVMPFPPRRVRANGTLGRAACSASTMRKGKAELRSAPSWSPTVVAEPTARMFTGPPAAIAAATRSSGASGVVNASDAAQAPGAGSCSARDETGLATTTSRKSQAVQRGMEC